MASFTGLFVVGFFIFLFQRQVFGVKKIRLGICFFPLIEVILFYGRCLLFKSKTGVGVLIQKCNKTVNIALQVRCSKTKIE